MSTGEASNDVVWDLGDVCIRRKRLSDAIDDYHWQRDVELARLNATAPYSGSYSNFLDVFENRRLYPGNSGIFSIETSAGAHIGNVMYYNADQSDGSAEYGITIAHPTFQGAGIGTAVTVAFLRLLWQTTPLRRIELHTLEWNERAIRCFRKAGFEQSARVLRTGAETLVRMEVRREWWLLWDDEGRYAPFERVNPRGLEASPSEQPKGQRAGHAD